MAPLRFSTWTKVRKVIAILLISLLHLVHSQSNIGQDPANANAENTIFYFDSNSDCNGPIREVYGFEATIRGNDLTSTRQGPKECYIRIQSTGQFDGTVLDIEVRAMNILDCTTKVTIYDGDGAQLTLMSYDCYSNMIPSKKRFSSTGNTATFVMTRENINSFNFDIEIKITPIRGGTFTGYEYQFGSGYFFDKFPQPTIVAIIGGFYGVILLVCSTIFIYFCCRFHKLNKKWEIQQLSTIKTGPAFDTKSQPSKAWSVEMKQCQGPGSQYSVGISDHRSRKTVAHSEDGDSDVLYNVDAFQKKRLMNVEKDKSRPSNVSSNASYTESEDDSDNFVEKVITSRVKTSNFRSKLPPAYEDAVSEHSSDNSTEEESENSTSESSVRKRSVSSEEEKSKKSHSSYTQSESVTESESDHSSRGRGARAHRHKRKPEKSRRKYSEESDSVSSRPKHPHKQPTPQAHLQMQQVPYGAHPAGQFVPVMVGPNQFQSVAMAPPFPPPSYAEQTAAMPASHVQPTEPPVYSYLVRRGYTPMDARSGSAASQRPVNGRSQEPELRLDSGVEYMTR